MVQGSRIVRLLSQTTDVLTCVKPLCFVRPSEHELTFVNDKFMNPTAQTVILYHTSGRPSAAPVREKDYMSLRERPHAMLGAGASIDDLLLEVDNRASTCKRPFGKSYSNRRHLQVSQRRISLLLDPRLDVVANPTTQHSRIGYVSYSLIQYGHTQTRGPRPAKKRSRFPGAVSFFCFLSVLFRKSGEDGYAQDWK